MVVQSSSSTQPVMGAAEGQIAKVDTIAKIFRLLLEALSRRRRNGVGTGHLLTSLWPGLMPRVLLVIRKLARAIRHLKVRCCSDFRHPAKAGQRGSRVCRHKGASAMGALCCIVPCQEQEPQDAVPCQGNGRT